MLYLPRIIKRCSRCHELKPLTWQYFVRDRSSAIGFTYECKTCHHPPVAPRYPPGATSRACRVCGKDTPLERLKKDKTCPYGRDALCKLCHNKQKSDYNLSHPDEVKARRSAEYYRVPPEERAKRRHEKYMAHQTEQSEYHHKRNQKPKRKEQLLAAVHRRRARILSGGGTYTPDDILDQHKRQKGKCYWCDKKLGKSYEIDHVIPLALGGSNDPTNIVVSCRPCNRHKGGKYPHERTGKLL